MIFHNFLSRLLINTTLLPSLIKTQRQRTKKYISGKLTRFTGQTTHRVLRLLLIADNLAAKHPDTSPGLYNIASAASFLRKLFLFFI